MSKVAEVLFWIHAPIVLIWFGLFLVPESAFPGKVSFHLMYMVSLYIIQYGFGTLYYQKAGKFISVCPLTVLTLRIRGTKWNDKAMYQHTFVSELMQRLNIKKTGKSNTMLIQHATLLIAVIQYYVTYLI